MAADRTTVSFKATPEEAEAIERFEHRFGKENKSEALRQMVEIGAREARSPFLYHLRGQVIEWAGHLGLAAIAVVVSGFMSTVFTPLHGLQIATVLVAMAFSLVACVELARVASGQSEIRLPWGVDR